MTASRSFATAVAALTAAALDGELCRPFVDAVEVTGAVISTLGRPLGSQTVCASDATAARIDEIQIDLGEGPGWESLSTRVPVLSPDLQRSGGDAWPSAREALRSTEVGALFCFPLRVGTISVGSVGLYTADAGALSPLQVESTTTLAGIVARQLLRRALAGLADVDEGLPSGGYTRREIHQATGMIAAQLGIGVDDAFLLLRGHAFAEGLAAREVADRVLSGHLVFSPED